MENVINGWINVHNEPNKVFQAVQNAFRINNEAAQEIKIDGVNEITVPTQQVQQYPSNNLALATSFLIEDVFANANYFVRANAFLLKDN